MFEVGKRYTIRMWEADDNEGTITTYPGCKVLKVEMPAIQIRQAVMADVILNTASIAFISATPDEDEEDEEFEVKSIAS